MENTFMIESIANLARKAAQYEALVETLFDGATLAAKMTPDDPDDIYIDCFDIRVLLKAFEPAWYEDTVELAKAKAEEKKRIREAEDAKEAADGAAD